MRRLEHIIGEKVIAVTVKLVTQHKRTINKGQTKWTRNKGERKTTKENLKWILRCKSKN